MIVYNELIAVTAGAGLLGFAGFLRDLLRGKRIESEGWAAFFGITGLLLLVLGLHTTMTWPYGGDGFESQVDPTNPNIVYAQAQHGSLVRFDRASGEAVFIQPQPEPGENGLRWNWDSPLIISPHSPSRLYFAANRVYRSDDRGDSWVPISADLSRQIDRNLLPVPGLAESWTVSDDGLVYRFELNARATFSRCSVYENRCSSSSLTS